MNTSPEFEACLPFILKEEGGYSNTPGDHGGATDFGIIQSEYNVYRHSLGLALQSVRLISGGEYRAIYWQSYWMPNCPKLPKGFDLSVFNINVNSGSGRGTRIIQKVLGIAVDGQWGPATDGAVKAIKDVRKAIVAFHDDERAFYLGIVNNEPSQRKFLSDWLGRNDRCEKLSLSMASPLEQALDAMAKPIPSIMKD